MANRVITLTDNGTWYVVKNERDVEIARFNVQNDAIVFSNTGVYPAGIVTSAGEGISGSL